MMLTSVSRSLFPKVLATGMMIGATLATAPAFAGENCQCRAAGHYYSIGAVACLGPRLNRQLARCEMTLNNTSWKMLGIACPLQG